MSRIIGKTIAIYTTSPPTMARSVAYPTICSGYATASQGNPLLGQRTVTLPSLIRYQRLTGQSVRIGRFRILHPCLPGGFGRHAPRIYRFESLRPSLRDAVSAGQSSMDDEFTIDTVQEGDTILAVAKMADKLMELAGLLKVLSVGTRVQIVQLLKGRALCVGALSARLDVTQGAVSQHLRIMRDAGLVVDEKCGYFVHYRLNEKTLAAWREELDGLLGPAAGASTDTIATTKCVAATTRERAARSGRPWRANPKTAHGQQVGRCHEDVREHLCERGKETIQ